MYDFPPQVEAALRNDTFARQDPSCVVAALAELQVLPGACFRVFFETFTGGYDSDVIGWLLLDLCEGRPTIVDQTMTAREVFEIPDRYLVLTDLRGGSVAVYDSETDQVYAMDFEGGLDQLMAGTLEPAWMSFERFLEEFFATRSPANQWCR